MARPLTIVVPGDAPTMIGGSPRLGRFDSLGEVILYDSLPKNEDEQYERVKDARVIINSRGQVKWTAKLLRRLPHLEVISLCSIGTDCVDLDAARELGITVCNVPGRTSRVVAEHAFALMFAVARRLAWSTAELKQGRWSDLLSVSLMGKTLGVLGTGNIGCELITMARAFGMNVIAWTFNPNPEKSTEFGFEYYDLEYVLQHSDVISVNCRLSDDSRGMIGAEQFELMKPNTIFINTARAAIVDTDAMIDAIDSGNIHGAGIDVFDLEPVPEGSRLLTCDQVVLTPHAADQLPEAMDALNDGAVENVIAFLNHQPQNEVT